MIYVIFAICLAFYLLAIVIGRSIGKHRRQKSLQKILDQKTIIPAYSLEHLLSPLEFEMLCTGKASKNGVAGTIAQSIMRGEASAKEDDDSLTINMISPQDRLALHAMLYPPVDSSLRRELAAIALGSLFSKGWVTDPNIKHDIQTTGFKYEIISLAVIVLGLFIGIVGISFIVTDHDTYQKIGIALALIGVFGVVTSLFVLFFIRVASIQIIVSSPIARRITPKFQDKYQEIYGLFLYMKVSGMDTMTPDYKTLDMRGLDRLYPYAVAVGLDKKLTKELFKRRITANDS